MNLFSLQFTSKVRQASSFQTSITTTLFHNLICPHNIKPIKKNNFDYFNKSLLRKTAGFQDGTAVGLIPVVLDAGFLEVLAGEAVRWALLELQLAEVMLLCLTLKRHLKS